MLSISLNPNIQPDDIKTSLQSLSNFLLRKKSNIHCINLQNEISTYFHSTNVFLTNSGRSALDLFFRSCGLEKGTEIAIQAFTCSAAIAPILWNGYKPLYIDVDESWNLDPKDLNRKLTRKTKAVIIQHSFGYPANIQEIKKICSSNGLLIIEDCAVSLGAEYENNPIGSFGDVTILSFGRDKAISGFGGALIIKNDELKMMNEKIVNNTNAIYQTYQQPSRWWTFKQLIYPIFIHLVLPIYQYKIGKGIIKLLQIIRLLSLPYSKKEYRAEKPDSIGFRLPDELAQVVLHQWSKLPKFVKQRRKISNQYRKIFQQIRSKRSKTIQDNIISVMLHSSHLQQIHKNSSPSPLRYNLYLPNVHIKTIIKELRNKHIYIGNWYSNIIDPKETDFKKYRYNKGSCPKAESLAGNVINLPTHIHVNENHIKEITSKVSLCL